MMLTAKIMIFRYKIEIVQLFCGSLILLNYWENLDFISSNHLVWRLHFRGENKKTHQLKLR